MVNPENYFDVWDVIANEVIGNLFLTILIGLILIYFFSAMAKFRFQITIMFAVLWLGVIYAITLYELVWVFAVLIAGTIFYFMVSTKIRKG